MFDVSMPVPNLSVSANAFSYIVYQLYTKKYELRADGVLTFLLCSDSLERVMMDVILNPEPV